MAIARNALRQVPGRPVPWAERPLLPARACGSVGRSSRDQNSRRGGCPGGRRRAPGELRIGGWLPPRATRSTTADDATQVIPRVPRRNPSREAPARAAATPRSRVRLAEETIHLGAFAPALSRSTSRATAAGRAAGGARGLRDRRDRRRRTADLRLSRRAGASPTSGVAGAVDRAAGPAASRREPVPARGRRRPDAAASRARVASPRPRIRGHRQAAPTGSRAAAAPDPAADRPRPPARPETVRSRRRGSAVRTAAAGPRSVAAASGGVIIGGRQRGRQSCASTGLNAPRAGDYDVVIYYARRRAARPRLEVNGPFAGGSTSRRRAAGTPWNDDGPAAVGSRTEHRRVQRTPDGWAPDFDRITLTIQG